MLRTYAIRFLIFCNKREVKMTNHINAELPLMLLLGKVGNRKINIPYAQIPAQFGKQPALKFAFVCR